MLKIRTILSRHSFVLLLLLSLFFQACQQDVQADILTPGGRVALPDELSSGTSTIFSSTSKAYDTPSDWVTGDLMELFLEGDALYDNPRVSGESASSGGLGPVYAGYSCASCHNDAGRTRSTLFTDGGSGPYGFSSFLTFIRTPNDQNLRQYGRVLHDQAIYGSEPEGKLRATYTEKQYSFPDGETYSLIFPHYEIYDWYADSIPVDQIELSVRVPLRHVGMGLMLAVNQNEILRLASIQYPTVQKGEELFYQAKCHLCRTPTLHTQSGGVSLIDGTRVPWLGSQVIHPYTDYLLHDMGPELGDDYSQFNATGDEWRTTPLWGVGLQEVVNGHSNFLHDGRARNFTEAIMWHGGEGDVSRQKFSKMTEEERETLSCSCARFKL